MFSNALDDIITGVFVLIIVDYFLTQALSGTAWYVTLVQWALPALIVFGLIMTALRMATRGGRK